MPALLHTCRTDWRRTLAAATLAALTACAPLAPQVPAPPARAPAPTPAPAASAPPATPAPRAAPAAPPPASAAAPTAPYGAAVAARFPDPAVRYDTPGLREGRYTTQAELQDALRALAGAVRAAPAPTVRLLSLGSSERGVPIEALLFTRLANAEPAALAGADRPTVLLVGQQHGDEPAGSEALLVVARELAGGRLAPLLDRINVIVLPRANPDGALTGQRAGAGGIDINRDHLLLRTPEAQAIAQLVRDYRPSVIVDAHEYTAAGRYQQKFGAVQRYDALVQYAMTANMPPFLTRAAEEWFRQPLLGSLQAEQLSVEWYYTTSTDPNDRRLSMGGVEPDNGRNVNGLKNTISFLVETRGAGLGTLHVQRRLHTQVTALRSLLASTALRAVDLLKLRQFVDADVSAQACKGQMLVQAAATPGEYRLVMLDPQTGADRPLTVDWESALSLQPRKLRARPCGYWLAADARGAVARLRTLGVQVQQLSASTSVQADTYREVSRTSAPRSDVRGSVADGAEAQLVEVDLVPTLLEMPEGSYYVPLTQPLANLVIAALEPDTQSSYLANGLVGAVDRVARVLDVPQGQLAPVP